MSEFRRFVAYIYTYEKGVKGHSLGFSKVELRNSMYRIQVQIKNTIFQKGEVLPVCLLFREKETTVGLPVGDMKIQGPVNESQIVLSPDSSLLRGHKMTDAAGIIIGKGKENVCLSMWDDEPFEWGTYQMQETETTMSVQENVTMFEEKEHPKAANVLEGVEEPETVSEAAEEGDLEAVSEAVEEEEPEAVSEAVEEGDLEAVSEAEGELEAVSEVVKGEAVEENLEIVAEPETMEETEEIRQQEEMGQQTCSHCEPEQEKSNFLRLYGKRGVRIGHKADIKDLRALPIVPWRIGNNPFLLKGYNDYGYLVVGDCVVHEPDTWFLAVPGVFGEDYAKIAGRFGFLEFWTEEEIPVRVGMRGYWARML